MASDSPPPYSSQPLPPAPWGYAPSPPISRRSSQPALNQHRQPRAHPHVPSRTGSGSGPGFPSPIARSGSAGSAGARSHHAGRDDPARAARRRTATETVAALAEGIYSARGTSFNLRRRVRAMVEGVRYYAPDERVAMPVAGGKMTEIKVVHSTTLDAARGLERMYRHGARVAREAGGGGASVILSPGAEGDEERWDFGVDEKKFPFGIEASTGRNREGRAQNPSSAKDAGAKDPTTQLPLIGILSSAGPVDPSRAFLAGETGQELSIARASTLSAALKTRTALQFYHPSVESASGGSGKGARRLSTQTAYHTHAMMYAPGVSVIRDEQGGWTPPMAVDVITCTAVHAGDARAAASTSASSPLDRTISTRPSLATIEARIEGITTERLARVLAVFASQSVHTLVLPAFGAGNFQNNIASVARIYAALLIGSNAPFAGVFDRVVFAITPEDKWREFERAFWGAVPERRMDRHAGTSGTQDGKRHAPKPQPSLRTLREDVPENSDGRSIMSMPDGRASTVQRTPRRPPRFLEDGASSGDWRLSLQGLSIQDGRTTVMSRRDNHSANESSRGINDWRSNIAESQDGALEYV